MTIEQIRENVVRVGRVSLPAVCGAIVCAVGLVVLIEWTFEIKLIALLSPTDSSMKVNTALTFLLSGASLWLWQSDEKILHRTAQILSVFFLLFVALILSQYIFNVNLGIDELIFRDHPNADITSHPGRMSPLVCLNFILANLALLFWNKETRAGNRPAEYLGLAAFLIPIVSTVGYLYSASRLYSFKYVTGIALISSITFLIFCVGLVSVKTKRGVMTIFLSESRAGHLLRQLLPLSLLALLLLDWLSAEGARFGFYGETVVSPLSLLLSGAVLTVLFWWNANLLFKASLSDEAAAARLATEHAVTRSIARAASFEEGAANILETMCRQLRTDVGCLWLPDAAAEYLYCAATKSPDRSIEMAGFKETSLRLTLKRAVGLPGEVWATETAIWFDDLQNLEKFPQTAKFPRAEVGRKAGLKSAFAFPLAQGETVSGVIEFYAKDKIVRDTALENMLTAIGSEIGQFVERDRLERERERLLVEARKSRDEATEANRLKDEFLAVVSHELRTPLNAILGWNRFLIMKPDAETIARVNEIVERQGKLQLQLIEDLLDTSQIISGKMRLNMKLIELDAVIENALEAVRPAADAKKINLSADYDRKHSTKITGDADRLQQVVWNLLSNAVRFTPEGGAVTAELRRENSFVTISVSDTGQGIEPDFLPFVFDRFRQADASITRRFGGLGLGLALVKHFTELHGGQVEAKSAGINAGATFIVKLPLRQIENAENA